MSVEALEKFFKKAESDAALQAQIKERIEGNEEHGCQAFAALAAEHGFEFTAEEMHDAIQRLREREEDRELTDEELESVAGGAYEFYMPPTQLPGMSTPMIAFRYGVPTRGY